MKVTMVASQRPEPGVVGPRQSVQKVAKVAKAKGNASGRTYTSKYRGVHQTFPTKRWEAQFRCTSLSHIIEKQRHVQDLAQGLNIFLAYAHRRNGKPTSLGCFDHEMEASRAYDKMMLWCGLLPARRID
jgi:AP2-like factor, euAP2 lineage